MWRMHWSYVPHRSLSVDPLCSLKHSLPATFPRDLLPLLNAFLCSALQVKRTYMTRKVLLVGHGFHTCPTLINYTFKTRASVPQDARLLVIERVYSLPLCSDVNCISIFKVQP